MSFKVDNYNVYIYRDGVYEYNGLYMVTIFEFDNNDKETDRYTYYFKASYKQLVVDYLKRNIGYVVRYRNNAKWELIPCINAARLPY